MKKLIVFFFMLLLLVPVVVFADDGTTGKVAGYVKDKATGEPLEDINIMIEGTERGAATDAKGYYVILNVPVGTYTLKISAVGYKTYTVPNVKVTVDLTTWQNIDMEEAVIEGETVTITADRPLIRADVTSSRSVASKEEFSELPVGNVTGVANLRAGYSAGTFRGGRAGHGETAYIVDGVSMANPTGNGRVGGMSGAGSNELATELPVLSVEEMEVLTGGWSAEYGQAQSAIINIISKQGSRTKHSGEIRVDCDPNYIMGEADFYEPIWRQKFGGPNPAYDPDTNPVPAKPAGQAFSDGNMIDWYRNFAKSRSVEWQLGGPEPISTYLLKDMIPGYLTYSLSGHYTHGQGANRNERGPNFGHSITLNLTYRPTSTMTVNFSGLNQKRQYYPYARTRDYYLTSGDLFGYADSGTPVYVPMGIDIDDNEVSVRDHYMIHNAVNQQDYSSRYQVAMTQTINPTTYYKVILSRFSTGQNYDTKDPITGNTLQYDDNGMMGFDAPRFKIPGTAIEGNVYTSNPIAINRSRKEVDQIKYNGKFDITSQVNDKHQIKAGLDVQYYDVYFEYWGVASGGNDYNSFYDKKPLYGAAYVTDKIELEGMIVNVGLRLDYINPNSKYSPILESGTGGSAVDTDFEVGDENRIRDAKTAKAKIQLSPRIGISHPITADDVLHFSYGHFFQFPQFDKYYTNYYLDLRGAFKYIGNPNLESEKTIQYEVGFEHRFSDNFGMDITGFYKDVTDLIQTRQVMDEYGQNFYMYANEDYSNIKGFELSFTKRYSHNFSGQMNYTLMWARGKNSNLQQSFSDLYNSRPPRTHEYALDWDRRHRIVTQATYKVPQKWGPEVAGNNLLGDWYVSLMYYYNSGLPYSSPSRSTIPPINDRRFPGFDQWDFRIQKYFTVFKDIQISAYADIFNVFDGRDLTNYANVEEYLRTGDPTAGSRFYQWVWQNPRTMRIGASVRF